MKIVANDMLDDSVLMWVREKVDSEATIESVQRLYGGMSSAVFSIRLKIDQEVKEFVLRQFDNKEWLQSEPDLALHEAESLRWAERIDLQTPKIIAFDETGSKCGGLPSVLMSRLEGTVNLKPENMEHWLAQMADALTKIHAVSADDFQWNYFTYNDITSLEIPSWTSIPEMWNEAIKIVKGPRTEEKPCFIHRDFHPTNILWSGDSVSGVVDWVNACKGPAGIDLGHCRLNLALLYDTPTADAFLFAYQRKAGKAFTYNTYWDILSVIDILFGPPEVYPGWKAFGVTGLTDEMMVERLEKYLESLLLRYHLS